MNKQQIELAKSRFDDAIFAAPFYKRTDAKIAALDEKISKLSAPGDTYAVKGAVFDYAVSVVSPLLPVDMKQEDIERRVSNLLDLGWHGYKTIDLAALDTKLDVTNLPAKLRKQVNDAVKADADYKAKREALVAERNALVDERSTQIRAAWSDLQFQFAFAKDARTVMQQIAAAIAGMK